MKYNASFFIPQPSHTVWIRSLNSVAGTITLDNVRTNKWPQNNNLRLISYEQQF